MDLLAAQVLEHFNALNKTRHHWIDAGFEIKRCGLVFLEYAWARANQISVIAICLTSALLLGSERFKSRCFHQLHIRAFIPRSSGIRFASISNAGRIVKVLTNEIRARGQAANGKWFFTHTFESHRECLHM